MNGNIKQIKLEWEGAEEDRKPIRKNPEEEEAGIGKRNGKKPEWAQWEEPEKQGTGRNGGGRYNGKEPQNIGRNRKRRERHYEEAEIGAKGWEGRSWNGRVPRWERIGMEGGAGAGGNGNTRKLEYKKTGAGTGNGNGGREEEGGN